jgi:glycosyltransferase involved in cell wall biosynthesis
LKPSISVVIPAYNSSQTILRALSSVFKQTLPPTEVIVVDDGSSDNTAKLVRETHPTVKLILQQNAGAAAARNTGVRVS